jgi:hypothetical protein
MGIRIVKVLPALKVLVCPHDSIVETYPAHGIKLVSLIKPIVFQNFDSLIIYKNMNLA